MLIRDDEKQLRREYLYYFIHFLFIKKGNTIKLPERFCFYGS
jgi:hypothetical protein